MADTRPGAEGKVKLEPASAPRDCAGSRARERYPHAQEPKMQQRAPRVGKEWVQPGWEERERQEGGRRSEDRR